MKNNKKAILTVAALALVGIILIIASGMFTNNEGGTQSQEEYAKEIEEKLENFLLQVDGIKEVKVIVSLCPPSTQSNSGLLGTDVTAANKIPTVCGVAIACTNGGSDSVKLKLTSLVSAFLGIPSNRIEIIDIK